MSEPNTCLTCRFLSEPDKPHKWHSCTWTGPMAKAIDSVYKEQVNIDDPFTDCRCWQQREV